jgi:hypothetical protein
LRPSYRWSSVKNMVLGKVTYQFYPMSSRDSAKHKGQEKGMVTYLIPFEFVNKIWAAKGDLPLEFHQKH